MDDDPLFLIGDTAERLGLTKDQLLKMGLKEFHRHCLGLGIVTKLGMDGVAPGLTIDFSTETIQREGWGG